VASFVSNESWSRQAAFRFDQSGPWKEGNPVPRPSKVKCIAPEEVIKLHSGVSKVPLPPASVSSRPYSLLVELLNHKDLSLLVQLLNHKDVRLPKPALATFEAPRHVPDRPIFKPPRPVPPRPTYDHQDLSLPVLHQYESNNSETENQSTSLSQPRTVELPLVHTRSRVKLPPSPRAFQIPSRVRQQDTTDATIHTIQETVVELVIKLKIMVPRRQDLRATSIPTSFAPYLEGRMVDSTTLFPEFDCQFWANPPSNISRKALRLSMAMPIFLEVELVPTGRILNNVLIPKLSDVELYFFLDEKEQSKGERAHLFETMASRKAMIKASVNGTELLIFSSTLLDKTSQFFIKKQHKQKTIFGVSSSIKNSQAHVPGTSHHLDDGNVVDMDIDPEEDKDSRANSPANCSITKHFLKFTSWMIWTNLLKALLIFRRKTVLES
ncbi:LOW QUALITY PROTEIN: hypothetical protein HID58_063670, partial [Brassica napus]